MKKLGLILITFGFLAGALVSVLDALVLDWGWFTGALVVGAVGVGLVRLGERREARSESAVGLGLRALDESLARLVERSARLDAEKGTIGVYDVRHRLDADLLDDLATFAEARETMTHAFGLQAYADVMSHFAAGERYVNRVWSASADGYVDEAREYLGRAAEQFVLARERFDESRAAAGP